MARFVTSLLLALGLGACAIHQDAPVLDVQPVVLRSGQPVEAPPGDAYDRGRHHLADRQYGLAIEAFAEELSARGPSVRLLNAIAITYDELGRFDLAQRNYDGALALEPGSVVTLNNYGRSLLRQGRNREALERLEQAHAAAADHPVVVANLELAQRPLRVSSPSSVMVAAHPNEREPSSPMQIEPLGLNRSFLRTQPAAMSSRPVLLTGGPHRTAEVRVAMAGDREPPSAPVLARIEVANGAGRRHMARRMRVFLEGQGATIDGLVNAEHFGFRQSRILFRPGFEAAAERLQAMLPAPVPMEVGELARRDVQLRLGADLLAFDLTLMDGLRG